MEYNIMDAKLAKINIARFIVSVCELPFPLKYF
jgi:hypothetical protein